MWFHRGLAHVAGFVLVVMGPAAEEAAFWVLVTLLEDKVFGYCGGQVGRAQEGMELRMCHDRWVVWARMV